MQEFKTKVCLMCNEEYSPTSPKQKFCISCKEKAVKLAQAERDKKRNRLKHSTVYERICPFCEAHFQTFDSKKKYCGSEECENFRCKLKSKVGHVRRDKTALLEKGRKYYSDNTDKCRLSTATRYRKNNTDAKDYVSRGKFRNSYEEVKTYIESEGYKLMSDTYINNRTKLSLQCSEGHQYRATYHSFRNNGGVLGNRCPYCYRQNNYVSKPEQLVRDFIQTHFPDLQVIYNDRSVLKPKELDIYIPSKNLAIEVCGLYWHSETVTGKPKSYHYDKMMGCYAKGIQLITIFEDELYEYKDVVFSNIRQALGETLNKICVEDCNLKEITLKEANDFYSKYHLCGKTTGTISYGLLHENKLICACSVGPVIKNNKASAFKLDIKRFCTLPDTYLSDGFTTIFETIKTNHSYKEIIAHCDMRYSNMSDDLYARHGFTLLTQSKFTPHYFKSQKRFKNSLNANNNYGLIWDCGHRTHIYKIN